MFGIGVQELIVILIIVLLLFGGKNLPQLSKNISAAIKEIRKGFSDEPEKSGKTVDKKADKK